LINEDVRFKGHVLFEEGKTFQEGHPVGQNDVKEIFGLYPSAKCPPDAAHVMIVKHKDNWCYAADLIYDRSKVKRRFEIAKDFLAVSNFCIENKLWGPFADVIFSAIELLTQSILLLHHHPNFSIYQGHPETVDLFSAYAKNGNIDMKFSNHYVNLNEFRKKGRYLIGLHGHKFSFKESKAKSLIGVTNELAQYVEKLLTSIDTSRQPPLGHYVAFGRTDYPTIKPHDWET